MQEDMKDFVTSQPAAGALFTVVLGELCHFSVATFWQKIERYTEGGGEGGLTMRARCGGCMWPSTRTAPVTGSPLGQARAWCRPWRRGSFLVGCWATKRDLSRAMCLS